MATPHVQRIGQRVNHYRAMLGIRSTTALADRIGNPKITPVVIQNIEAGRKTEVTIGQVIDIAAGLGISPLLLLVDIQRPFEIDATVVDGGLALTAMTPAEFLTWARVDPAGTRPESPELATLNEVARDVIAIATNLGSITRLRAVAAQSVPGSDQSEALNEVIAMYRNGQAVLESRLDRSGVSLDGLRELRIKFGDLDG